MKKQLTKSSRIESRVVDKPAKFEYQEEVKTSITGSAVKKTVPMILNNATRKKWSAQLVKISVKDLGSEDQQDLVTALSKTDNVRTRLTKLLRRIKLLPKGTLR